MKKIDYSKIKAMAQSILECIGDESEGENPSLPKQKEDINDGGQDELYETAPAPASSAPASSDEEDDDSDAEGESEPENKKRKRDASLAMMSSMLASKFK